MKSINYIELQNIVDFLKGLEGAEFQKISGPLNSLCFQFWDRGPKILVLSCLTQKPFVVYTNNKKELGDSVKVRTEEKPISLFIKAHFIGQLVSNIKLHKQHARVFEMHFKNEAMMEFRLFSGGGNLSAHHNGKSVFLRKPQELRSEDNSIYEPDLVRSPQVIFEQGLEFLLTPKKSLKKPSSSFYEAKLNKAKEKIRKAIKDLEEGRFQKLAKALEIDEELRPELKDLYKKNLSKRENIEWAYKQSKVSEQKKQRLEERLEYLTNLEAKEKTRDLKPKKNQSSKGVQHQLNEKIVIRCGRNAKENLDLLRRAKPWHLWMHLTDYPSGHLIIDLPKGEKLSLKELEKCAHFLFLRGAPKKLLNTPSQRYAVMYTECRFVRAQKKNKGLVTTQNHQSLILTWNSKYLHSF